jgi:hypothetical protein
MSETEETASERIERWAHHLRQALHREDQTVVLADMDAKGSMAMQVLGTRPRDLLDIARSLLEQARDRWEEEPESDATTDMMEVCEDALAILPHEREAP